MKAKGILQCAALLTGLLFLNVPLFAAVESDIVGYTTIPMEAGKWYQVGYPFVSLEGNASDTIAVNDCFTSGFSSGDRLYVLDLQNGGYEAGLYWVPSKNAWCDRPNPTTAEASDKVLNPGQAVYINKKVTGNVTVSGRVQTQEVAFGDASGNTWNQVCAVWPEAVALSDLKWSNLSAGDRLYVLDSENGGYEAGLYWVPSKNAWCNLPNPTTAVASDKVLSPGQAVYIQKKSSGVGTLIKE